MDCFMAARIGSRTCITILWTPNQLSTELQENIARKYAFNPLVIWHEGGYSNTWGKVRGNITGLETKKQGIKVSGGMANTKNKISVNSGHHRAVQENDSKRFQGVVAVIKRYLEETVAYRPGLQHNTQEVTMKNKIIQHRILSPEDMVAHHKNMKTDKYQFDAILQPSLQNISS
mmetsp:Transcript_13794/g.17520  ORF Transcript_13794/g.17520 Transcript_13794/m.17520 type:complete len:174 (-) Transcript_13794:16-537(-)